MRFPSKQQQLAVGEGQTYEDSVRIHGLCISPDSQLWVNTNVSKSDIWLPNSMALTVSKVAALWLQVGLYAFQLLRLWSTNTHKHWPRLFNTIVRELLVGCLAQHTAEGTARAQRMLLCS